MLSFSSFLDHCILSLSSSFHHNNKMLHVECITQPSVAEGKATNPWCCVAGLASSPPHTSRVAGYVPPKDNQAGPVRGTNLPREGTNLPASSSVHLTSHCHKHWTTSPSYTVKLEFFAWYKFHAMTISWDLHCLIFVHLAFEILQIVE